jgi:hypothetical protein
MKKYKTKLNKPAKFGWFRSASKKFKKLMARREIRRAVFE